MDVLSPRQLERRSDRLVAIAQARSRLAVQRDHLELAKANYKMAEKELESHLNAAANEVSRDGTLELHLDG